MWLPGVIHAQGPGEDALVIDWQEVRTEHFLIVYAEGVSAEGQALACACGAAEAEGYVDFVDTVYLDLVDVFGVELETPISLHLFPTEESYYAVNPLAERLTGVIAHALNDRQEIAIALPRAEGLTEDELVNNVRHELTHLFASRLSDGKLSTGFQEGVAQYLEKPTAGSDYDPALLRIASQEGRLLSWAELDQAQRVYSDPQVAYPQTLSMVSFLVDRYGFSRLVDLIRAAADEPGYRSALEMAYEKSADELEAEWLAYLPEYFDGRWKINAIYAYDLSRATELVKNGAYSSAQSELQEIIALLETTNQETTLAEAEALLARTHQGQDAGRLADEARRALQAHDYAEAIAKGNAAIAAYEQIGYLERQAEIQLYIERARLGQQARRQLSDGQRLLDGLQFAEAESQLHRATAVLQSLNDQTAAQRGLELLTESASRQRSLAHGLFAAGLVTLCFNGIRRILNRSRPDPLEVGL